MRPVSWVQTIRLALAATAATVVCVLGPLAGAAAATPAAGAVLTAPPPAVTVTLPTAPAAGAQLAVLNADRQNLADGPPSVSGDTLRVGLPRLAAGVYTVSWSAGSAAGAYTFIIWQGGALPPELARAAYGGPLGEPQPPLFGPALLAALLAALLGLGSFSVPARTGTPPRRGRSPAGLLATAGVLLATAGSTAALTHTAAVLGVPIHALRTDPLTTQVLWRGVALDSLVAAGAGVLAAVTAPAVRLSAALLTVALIPILLAIPAVQGGSGLAFLGALAMTGGLGLYGGAWPYALRHRVWTNPVPRLAGLVLTLAAGIPVLLRWQPAGGVLLTAGLAALALALLLGRPNAGRHLTRAASALGLAGVVTAAPALGASSPWAGTRTAAASQWAYSAHSGAVTISLSSLQPGPLAIGVQDRAARARSLTVTLTDLAVPALSRVLHLPQVGAHTYALKTDALSQAGAWTAAVGGQSFQLKLLAAGRSVRACQGGFTGSDALLTSLGGPVVALATDPGDGTQAIAATNQGVFATDNGGISWRPAGDPGTVQALAIGLYGEWFAATTQGLRVSQDGGTHWQGAPGAAGSATAVTAPLFPNGAAAWALSSAGTYDGISSQTFSTVWTTHWAPQGPLPADQASLFALPAAHPWLPTTLLSAGLSGLTLSTDGGAHWQAVGGVAGPLRTLAPAPGALWAAGPAGLFTAATISSAWHRVSVPVPGAVQAAAASGGGELFVAVQDSGLLASTDGGAQWHGAGCPGGTISVLAGTYAPGQPKAPTATPLVYLGNAAGQVVALWPSGSLASGGS